MAKFKIGTRYLAYMQAKLFMRNAYEVEQLGQLGEKHDLTGSFNTALQVQGALQIPGAKTPDSSVRIIALNKKKGRGYVKFKEVTGTVKGELDARGSSAKVIVGEVDFYSIDDYELLKTIETDENALDYFNRFEKTKKICVADKIVKVKSLRQVKVSDINVGANVEAKIQKVIDLGVGVEVESQSFSDLTVSVNTTLAFGLMQIYRKRSGEISYRIDRPGR